ncbi:hypothetical protein DRP77_07940 [Candidatus Poribacteria bacterium]|nr:MAG: hypothetical protein DRP77_07940 [Candidatus Poribacteria bacterium]
MEASGMMKRDLAFAISIAAGLAAILAFQALTIPRGPRGPGPPPGMAPDRLLEASWAFICFELRPSDEQLPELRRAYEDAWSKLRRPGEGPPPPEEVREAMSQLHERLRAILTPEQMDRLMRWERMIRGRFPPPGRGR